MAQPLMKYTYKSVNWSGPRFMDILDANAPHLVYLRRLIVFKTPLVGLYVHWIYTKDDDRDPHNHPFHFWSWVVKGGYTEVRSRDALVAPVLRHRRQWSLARTTKTFFHRIIRLDESPTITVILTGKRGRWGFLTPEGYMPQEEYTREKEARWRAEAAGGIRG